MFVCQRKANTQFYQILLMLLLKISLDFRCYRVNYMRLYREMTLLQLGQQCSTSLQESTKNGIKQHGQILYRKNKTKQKPFDFTCSKRLSQIQKWCIANDRHVVLFLTLECQDLHRWPRSAGRWHIWSLWQSAAGSEDISSVPGHRLDPVTPPLPAWLHRKK